MGKLILGIDGGSTKSHLALFDDGGKCIKTEKYGALNHEVMAESYADLERHLRELLPRMLGSIGAGADDLAYMGFGLAGMDTKSEIELVSGMIRKIGIKDFTLCNDAILGVPAGCPEGVGICAINGSGFKLAAIDYNGFTLDICGTGGYTDDRGGGTWYGERTCGEVYNALFKLGRPTMMRELLFEVFGITDKSELLDRIVDIINGEYEQLDRVALNSIVFKAAGLGDDVALAILDESAVQYAGAIARLATDMHFPHGRALHVTLAGSVFVKQQGSPLHDMLKKHVAGALGGREVTYSCLDAPPVAGAVILAAQRAGFDLDPAAVKSAINASGL